MKHFHLLALLCSALCITGCSTGVPALHWSFGPVMPVDRSARATAAVEHLVVTVGGTRWQTGADERKTKQWLSAVDALDTRTQRWGKLPDYPLAAGYALAASVGRRLYACGGRSGDRGHAETFVLDLAHDPPAWEPGPPLPVPRWGHAGGMIGSVLYVAGGFEGDPATPGGSRKASAVLCLDTDDPASGWRHVAELPNTETDWVTATTCAGRLYLFCATTDEAFALDPSTGRWQSILPPPTPLSSGAATAIDDRYVLLAGGSAPAVQADLAPDGRPRNYIAHDCFL